MSGTVSSTFGGKGLKAADLQSRAVPVVIGSWREVTFKRDDGPDDVKIELGLVGKEKTFIANKTNCKAMANIFASERYDDWVGQTVVLFPAEVEYAGNMVAAIRVRAVEAPAPPPPAETADGDDIPF